MKAIWLQTHHCFKLLGTFLCIDCCVGNNILIKPMDMLKTFKSTLYREVFQIIANIWCTSCSFLLQSVLLKHGQIFKSNCSLKVKLNRARASREVRFFWILECSWVKEKKLFNCWQFGDFQMTNLIGMIFSDYNVCIHLTGKATNRVILHPGTNSFFSLKVFAICEREKDLKLLSTIICYSLTTCLFEMAIAWWNAGYIHSLP